MSMALAEHLEQTCTALVSFASASFSDVPAGDAGVDLVTFDRDSLHLFQVKGVSGATDLDLRKLEASIARIRLRLDGDCDGVLRPVRILIALHDLGKYSDAFHHVDSSADPSGLIRLVRGREPVPHGPAEERPPRSAVIAEACRALGQADVFEVPDVLARTLIGVSPASLGRVR
jgi:hypothetical protein